MLRQNVCGAQSEMSLWVDGLSLGLQEMGKPEAVNRVLEWEAGGVDEVSVVCWGLEIPLRVVCLLTLIKRVMNDRNVKRLKE